MKSIRCRSRRGSGFGTFLTFSKRVFDLIVYPQESNFPMRPARSIPPAIRTRSTHTFLQNPTQLTLVENEAGQPSPVLHCLPLNARRGKILQFENFDEAYVARLRAAEPHTEQHFVSYFTALIKIKLRSRLYSPEAADDVRQETFSRFFLALRAGKIQHPDRLGSYVNSMCNNVLREQYRSTARDNSRDNDDNDSVENELPATDASVLEKLETQEVIRQVRETLDELSERDRRLLREVFLEERDKDAVCRDFDIKREYLRVLLLRAKEKFATRYRKNHGEEPPKFGKAQGF
jgi:RNA polymerase sigma-70 factor (ECF subfamily)